MLASTVEAGGKSTLDALAASKWQAYPRAVVIRSVSLLGFKGRSDSGTPDCFVISFPTKTDTRAGPYYDRNRSIVTVIVSNSDPEKIIKVLI
jgi:hypothetical protein